MLKILLFFLVTVSAISMEKFDLDKFGVSKITNIPKCRSWRMDAVQILCNFNATVISIVYDRKPSNCLDNEFLQEISECGTAVIVFSAGNYNVSIVNNNYGMQMYMVLIISNTKQPISLSHIQKKSGDKQKSFFIILIEDATDIYDDWLKASFRKFWDLWILNFVIIFWKDKLQIYSYSPFSTDFLKPLESTVRHKHELFPEKLANLNKYPLRIAMHPEEGRAIFDEQGDPVRGVDVFLMNLIIERLNATPIIMMPFDLDAGVIYEDKTGDGSIGKVIQNEADITFNARLLMPYLFEEVLESSIVIGRDDLCVLLPKRREISPLLSIFRPFKIVIWIMIFVVLLVVLILLKNLLPHESRLSLWLISWSLTVAVPKFPKNRFFRIFLLFWLIYTIVISGSYKGNLTSYLVLPTLQSEINSIGDLVESGYEILLDQRYESYLNNSLQERIVNLIRPVTTEYFKTHLKTNNLSFGYMDIWHLQFQRLNNKQHVRNGQILFYLVRTCPIPFDIVYVAPYGSPYLGFINKIIRWSEENGLSLYWADYMATLRKVANMRVIRWTNPDAPKVIKLYNIQAAFLILLFGLGIACLVFLFEKCWIKMMSPGLRFRGNQTFDFVN